MYSNTWTDVHGQMYPCTLTDEPKYMDRCTQEHGLMYPCTYTPKYMGIIDMSIIMNDRKKDEIFNNVEQNYFCIGIMFQSPSHKIATAKEGKIWPEVIKLFSCSTQLYILNCS